MTNLSKSFGFCLFCCALTLTFLAAAAQAQPTHYSLLYSFCSQANCADGSPPSGPLIADSDGNLYGETEYGGSASCSEGCGTVFRLSPDGTETVLYQFCSKANCIDGEWPTGGLTRDKKGNLYGTTLRGGNCADTKPCPGAVFKLSPDGTETMLHSFCSNRSTLPFAPCNDGFWPNAGVVMDKDGNLYGTTGSGSNITLQFGTVFKLARNGKETILYAFCQRPNCTDGTGPAGGLIMDGQGNLYGTAGGGNGFYCQSSGCGTVFKVTPDGTETVLHAFCTSDHCPDGYEPVGNLVIDGRGNLFGATTRGGSQLCYRGMGCGTIFEISPDGNESVLYSFCSMPNCADGYFPYAGPVADAQHNLYAAASFGGGQGCDGNGCGTVVEFARNGQATLLTSFQGAPTDGAYPQTSLTADRSGAIYGTTSEGGTGTQCGYALGCGTAFALQP